jgi:transportin-1
MPEAEERIRAVACLLLKNNSNQTLNKWPPHLLQYVKANILPAFNDQSVVVRNAAGQVVVAMLDILGPERWPEVLQLLLQSLDSPSIDQQLVRFFLSPARRCPTPYFS